MAQALARITPVRIAVPRDAPSGMTGPQKAAVIVRFLLSDGVALPLSSLPDEVQDALTEQIVGMRLVDRATLDAVVLEFVTALEQVGLSFPGGLDGALSILDGHISPDVASRKRRQAGALARSDPWERIAALAPDRLLPVLEVEAVEVGAVMLSKLPVQKAADLLSRLSADKARRVAHAVSLTGDVDPATVRRIGHALATQLDSLPPKAFEAAPQDRVGAILNVSPAATREAVLTGLAETDADFAEQVRRAIFTFAHIPQRLLPRDVPKVLRLSDPAVLVTAMAGAAGADRDAAEFLLANMSQRMAAGLREDVAARGTVKPREAEEAMNAVVEVIRSLEGSGDITLIQPED